MPRDRLRVWRECVRELCDWDDWYAHSRSLCLFRALPGRKWRSDRWEERSLRWRSPAPARRGWHLWQNPWVRSPYFLGCKDKPPKASSVRVCEAALNPFRSGFLSTNPETLFTRWRRLEASAGDGSDFRKPHSLFKLQEAMGLVNPLGARSRTTGVPGLR